MIDRVAHNSELSLTEPEAARRTIGRAFKPGVSGNPTGMSKVYIRTREMVRQASEELMSELITLALTAQDERVKSVCLIACLDRAGLRPIDHDPTDKPKAPLDVSKLSPEERDQLRGFLDKMASGPANETVDLNGTEPEPLRE